MNPFGLLANEPLFDAIIGATRLVTVALALAVLILIVRRWQQASRPSRRQLNFVLLAGAVAVAALASDILIYMTQAYALIEQTVYWTVVVARAAVPIGFLFGLLQVRMDRGLVAQLVVELGGAPTPERLLNVVGRALHDPSVSIAYWSRSSRQFLDADGQAVDLALLAPQAVRIVERDGEPLCALAYDPALSAEPELIDGVAAALSLALDRSRLESMVHAQADAVSGLPTGTVTFLHADIEGSTELLEQLADGYAEVLAEERRLLRQICRVAGGQEVDSRADEFFAVFPAGSSPADAALGIMRRLRTQAWPHGVTLKVRIGLHSGTPQLADEGYVGVDVHIAARIGAAGHGGQVLVSETAADRITPTLDPAISLTELGMFELKGVSGRFRIFQLVAPDLANSFPCFDRLPGWLRPPPPLRPRFNSSTPFWRSRPPRLRQRDLLECRLIFIGRLCRVRRPPYRSTRFLRYVASRDTATKPHDSYRCRAPDGFWLSTPSAASVMPRSRRAEMVWPMSARARPRRRHGRRVLMFSTQPRFRR